MKRKYFLILAAAVLLIGSLSGCGKEANETDETVTQESLYEEESKESEKNDAAQDDTTGEVPDWLAAYVDYIEGMKDYDSHDSGSFIYVDEDDIPEFVMYTGSAYIVLTFQDGDVDELQTGQLRFRYIEGKNLICDASGRAGEYAHHVYSIENGKWTCVAEGKFISEFRDGLQFNRYFFEWEGEKVEEELYWDRLHQVFDEEQAIVPKDYRKVADMLYHMKAGDFVWETVDEQHTEEDIGEVIADFEYSDENIPISKVDFASYKKEMSEEDWLALSSFFPILLEGKTFDVQVYDWKRRADVFEEHSINDLYAVWADMFLEYPDKFVLDEFTLCDITGDGQKELVLYSGFHYAVGMYCIFHREGDHFYAICENIRSFEDLQVNGLYYGAEGASSGSYWRLHFLRDVFWEEEIAKYNAARDYYKIGGEEVSEAEMAAWEDEVMVGDVVWYEARADWEIASEDTSNDYLIEDIQCIWGTWVITEAWAGPYRVDNKDNMGTIIKILPDSFSFGDKTSEEITGYTTEVLAVIGQDELYRETGTYGELGMTGDYFLEFYPKGDTYKLDIFPFTAFILLSETEMMIPLARSDRYVLEKVQDDLVVEADVPLLVGGYSHSVGYGEWLITDAIKTDGTLEGAMYVGKTLKTSDKLESFTSCRALGRSSEAVDELADLVGIGENNQYLIIYDFSEHYFWEQMICIDDMTAVLVKGNNLFRIERISDPMEDRIYNEIG